MSVPSLPEEMLNPWLTFDTPSHTLQCRQHHCAVTLAELIDCEALANTKKIKYLSNQTHGKGIFEINL